MRDNNSIPHPHQELEAATRALVETWGLDEVRRHVQALEQNGPAQAPAEVKVGLTPEGVVPRKARPNPERRGERVQLISALAINIQTELRAACILRMVSKSMQAIMTRDVHSTLTEIGFKFTDSALSTQLSRLRSEGVLGKCKKNWLIHGEKCRQRLHEIEEQLRPVLDDLDRLCQPDQG